MADTTLIMQFLIANFSDTFLRHEDEGINFIAQSYNSFKEVMKAYPNKQPVTNTDSDRLTQNDVITFLVNRTYPNILEGNEELAELCSMYGYAENEFTVLQNWFEQGKSLNEEELSLSAHLDKVDSKITFELLKKNDPVGAVLGNITNCCQVVNDAGESCVEHGMTDKNGGFLVFKTKENGKEKIIGQAWVWYNPELKKVCLDNIEVPRSAKKFINNDFLDCLDRTAKSIKESMEERGFPVELVTMGKGYNDILEKANKRYAVKVNAALAQAAISCGVKSKELTLGGNPSGVYSDISQGELLIL